MTKHRANRLAETLKEEISQLIREQLKDPRLGFVTVTAVDAAEDLSRAKVYVSVLGSPEDAKASLLVLNRAAGYIRSEIGKRVRLRQTPEIVFKYDPSIEHGAHIAKLLREVQNSGTGDSHEE
ncbi:Ribosome-binding factor A domain protein [Acididesulfobacillus acetoxydans]|uniref:Ribosome-binding factor A n=1 Tax=Acididesulfobacillus acetoxydans TaxID=1561005 RepID=A0A8S0XZP9_9FIRM|nr:30S ribosome-binding factor RbfA [Acididesulfobacillus acetoxydans]CAA7602537.1 Ribosome-binding factor A domain protein [Acididesulfobacillus acetoxydans]CEJ06512.1 Ribosome-binding factor A [Acididesulfobacillus acetoxydans]